VGEKGWNGSEIPMAARVGRAGVNWGLRRLSTWPRGCLLLCLRAGGRYSLVHIDRERALGGRMCYSKGCSRVEAGVRTGVVSVGNGGLQLLQAAATELCCIGLPVLRQLLRAN